MNTTLEEGRILAEALAGCPVPGGAEVVLCPPFLHLVPVVDILRDVPPPLNGAPGRIGYKTGTSYGYRDAIAVGFDSRETIAVWLGRADNGAVHGLVARQAAAPA